MEKITYVAAELGDLYPVSENTHCVFNGLQNHPDLAFIDGLLCPSDLVNTPTDRAQLLSQLLPRHTVFSHQTAHWIHTGEGSPFPIRVVSAKRTRRAEPLIRYFRSHPLRDLEPGLPVPVVSAQRTAKDLQSPQ